jgi:pyruvate kinase
LGLIVSHSQSDCPFHVVATLGPKSFTLATALAKAGATEFRLNASHMSADEVARRCRELRRELPDARCTVDLQGKKMRVGNREALTLTAGQAVRLCDSVTDTAAIYVPHPELFAQARVGEHLTFDDGRLEVQIDATRPNELTARVLRGGVLGTRKGLNRTEHPIKMLDLSVDDRATVLACAAIDGINFAVSFVEDGVEADWVRKLAPKRRVALKIERQEAVENWLALAERADELWICRGDLGAQLGPVPMARAIASISPRQSAIPVLMAGQVLEHLTHHETPTRSEVCHLFDLVQRGYAGLVLSDETATGDAPVTAVSWAARLLHEIGTD